MIAAERLQGPQPREARVGDRPFVARYEPAELPGSPGVTESGAAINGDLPEPHPRQVVEALLVTVTDASGAPVPDALVEVWDPPSWKQRMAESRQQSALLEKGALTADGMQQILEFARKLPDPTWEAPRLTLRTDSEGRCLLPDLTARTILVASKEGVGTSGVCPAVPAPMTLRLQPMGRVHGVVKDSNDVAVAGATVRFHIPGSGREDGGPRTPRPVQTGDAGEFDVTIDAGALGTATALRGPPEQTSSEDVFSVQPGEVDEVVLLFADGTISGRVTWDDGEPVGRAMIQAILEYEPASSGESDPTMHEWLEKDGSFRLEHLRPGRRYRLSVGASAPAYVSAKRRDVETGATGVVLVLNRKDAAGVTLRGRVVDMETGASVRQFETTAGWWSDSGRGQPPAQGASHENDEGRFELSQLSVEPTAWALEIRAPGYEPAIFGPIRPADATEFEFAIGHAGSLSVEVAGVDGQPAGGAHALLYDEVTLDGRDLTAAERADLTSVDGRVEWQALRPGPRWLLVEDASGSVGPIRLVVPSGGEAIARCRLSAEPPAGTLRVELLDAERRPLPAQRVKLERCNESGRHWFVESSVHREIPTDSVGWATADQLQPGVYIVSTVADETWITGRFVVVPEGDTASVELRAR
ncbi:MAG TPA: carboxypeptidase-like regulatory domain-containing protein [Planctomycetota bacterium]|nr:carboxypeptidase-like regulatory domain-containing protein [Planctomycetota bacterium]